MRQEETLFRVLLELAGQDQRPLLTPTLTLVAAVADAMNVADRTQAVKVVLAVAVLVVKHPATQEPLPV